MQEQTEKNIIPFNFQGMALRESCWIDGRPHFTRKAIGEFLEYERPRAAMHHILARNPYILKYRTVVKLTTVEASPTVSNLDTVGGKQTTVNLTTVEGGRSVSREIEVFNAVGLQCIFFESHQPKAIQYKIAVAELVEAIMYGSLKPSKWSQKGDLVSAARQILSLPEGRKRAALIADLIVQEGCSPQQTYIRIQKATGERLKTRKGVPRRTRSCAGSHRNRPEYQAVMAFVAEHPEYLGTGNQHKDHPKKDIPRILGLSISASRINAWLREGKNIH